MKAKKVFDKSGKGKKQCAKCSMYVGNIHSECVCGSTKFVKTQVNREKPEIKFFDGPGQARKQCANCNHYIASACKTCRCGSTDFITKHLPETKTWDKPKPSRKQCLGCKLYVGHRIEVCPCGSNQFSAVKGHIKKIDSEGDRKDAQEAQERRRFKGNIVTPSGDCPVKLESTDEVDVRKWALAVISYGRENKFKAEHKEPMPNPRFFTDEALIYFVREFYSIQTEEYQVVAGHLCNMFAENKISVEA